MFIPTRPELSKRTLSDPLTSNCNPPVPNPFTLAILEAPEKNSTPELKLVEPDFSLKKL